MQVLSDIKRVIVVDEIVQTGVHKGKKCNRSKEKINSKNVSFVYVRAH